MKISANISIYVVDDKRIHPLAPVGMLNYNRSGEISGENFQEIARKLDMIDEVIDETIDQEPML